MDITADSKIAMAVLRNVSKRYGQVTAVDRLSLDIRRGEVLALLGPNGAGKTTSVNLLLGLAWPTSGTVELFGRAPRDVAARRRIGAMLQGAQLGGHARVGEVIRLYSGYYPEPMPLAGILHSAGLEDQEKRPVLKLSGSRKQRLRFALAAMLELEEDLSVVARASNGKEALKLAAEFNPDVVVTDIEMPGMTGLELAAALKDKNPATRVIIVTTFARPGYLRRALNAGVKGYLLKDAPAEQLAEAIRKVHRGGKVIAPELAAEAWDTEDPLSDRERQVLRLAGEGLASADIARQLFLSEGTVRNYLSEAIGKLGAANRIEAARIARQKGWL